MTRFEQQLVERIQSLEQQVANLTELQATKNINNLAYSVGETAKLLGVTRQTVYRYIELGELETTKIGTIKILGSSLRKKLGIE